MWVVQVIQYFRQSNEHRNKHQYTENTKPAYNIIIVKFLIIGILSGAKQCFAPEENLYVESILIEIGIVLFQITSQSDLCVCEFSKITTPHLSSMATNSDKISTKTVLEFAQVSLYMHSKWVSSVSL